MATLSIRNHVWSGTVTVANSTTVHNLKPPCGYYLQHIVVDGTTIGSNGTLSVTLPGLGDASILALAAGAANDGGCYTVADYVAKATDGTNDDKHVAPYVVTSEGVNIQGGGTVAAAVDVSVIATSNNPFS